ncbi:Crp/Fnr family transcriptional regulator [Parapedobacter indicus]|uniref:cAMP-binding domain of CRP or a regulatory subunit of cAMP-dependent protein kinases n=1 Tax=Parapedobacter indicus TaxID=1477437 RepID=A0A1I3VBT0_9SPHI|nr:CRP-like cAMP-binding protein [Parapedobacter indicus]SFJ92463.1 cAMP-binding domain of CRP or a regulatory subunit of cAMP-dependent protein kinases [Parapedobacter indicus]
MPEDIFNFFENYIRTYELFSDGEIATIKSLAIPKQLKKRQFLLRQGSVCRYHTLVCSGCIRSYRIDDEGCEHIIGLSPSGHWVNDPVSLLSGSPSNEFIDALEDSTVIQLSTNSFKTLLENIPNFKELNNRIITNDCDVCRDRIFMMLSLQAEDRYREFIRNFPKLHERIPIYMIASYLGVSRETLTRIRSNMLDL